MQVSWLSAVCVILQFVEEIHRFVESIDFSRWDNVSFCDGSAHSNDVEFHDEGIADVHHPLIHM